MELNLKHLNGAFVNCPFIKNSSGIYLTTLHRLKQILVNTLTGGAGSDTFVFGKVWTQVVTGVDDEVQTYVNTAFDLTGVDTITDFASGMDKIELNTDQFASLVGFNTGNLVIGTGPLDADDYLVFNTSSNTLQYFADGNGGSAAFDIALLTGVSSITAADIALV